MGAPSPFERQMEAEVAPTTSSPMERPVAAAAWGSRAPSTWSGMPSALVASAMWLIRAPSVTRPPAKLWVFSTTTSRVGG